MRTDPIRSGVARVGGVTSFSMRGVFFVWSWGAMACVVWNGRGRDFFHDFPDG
jgi:hypothetical protein